LAWGRSHLDRKSEQSLSETMLVDLFSNVILPIYLLCATTLTDVAVKQEVFLEPTPSCRLTHQAYGILVPDRQTVTQCLIPVYSDVLLCDLFCLSVDPNKTIDLGILIRMTDRAIRNQVEHPRKRDRGCSRPISAYTHARSKSTRQISLHLEIITHTRLARNHSSKFPERYDCQGPTFLPLVRSYFHPSGRRSGTSYLEKALPLESNTNS